LIARRQKNMAAASMSATVPTHVYEVLLAIAQLPSYIPGGASSFWRLIDWLLLAAGFLIVLWLIWVVLRWIIEKLGAAFRKK
jgi:hypothetical protein